MRITTSFLALALCASALPLQAQDWQGWHVGLQLGLGQAEGEHDITLDGFDFLNAPFGPDDMEGSLIGVRGGYDWVRGPLVYGVEAEVSKTEIDDFFSNSGTTNDDDFYETKIDSLGSIRGRFGYLVGPDQNTLLYGVAGIAGADVFASNGDADTVDGKVVDDCDGRLGCAKDNETVLGGTVGVGVEHQFTNVKLGAGNLSVGLEYAYYDFGDVDFKTQTTDSTPADHEFDVDLSAHTLQAVVRMRF